MESSLIPTLRSENIASFNWMLQSSSWRKWSIQSNWQGFPVSKLELYFPFMQEPIEKQPLWEYLPILIACTMPVCNTADSSEYTVTDTQPIISADCYLLFLQCGNMNFQEGYLILQSQHDGPAGSHAGADPGFCARGVQNFARVQNSDFSLIIHIRHRTASSCQQSHFCVAS